MLSYAYKTQNCDFCVNEILNLVLDSGQYNYYFMNKDGIRTIDVIDAIADEYGIATTDITYAGLKDEDAVTMQHIAIKDRKIDNCKRNYKGGEYSLTYIGSSDFPIEIGKLLGNSFKIRLRNLSLESAEKLKKWEKHAFSIINYFDTQRFGMPHMPKLTHLIGKALLEENYEKAFYLMLESGNIDEKVFKEWKGRPESYFASMESRRKGFFLSAFDSYEWNNAVGQIIKSNTDLFIEYPKDEIVFIYVVQLNDSVRNQLDLMKMIWHRYDVDGSVCLKYSYRQAYLDVIYKSSSIYKDDIYEDRYMLDIEFVLPAGAYATNFIDQLMNILQNKS